MARSKKPAPKKRAPRVRAPRVLAEFHVHLPENTEAKVERIGSMTHIHVNPPALVTVTRTWVRDLTSDALLDSVAALLGFHKSHPRVADAAERLLLEGLQASFNAANEAAGRDRVDSVQAAFDREMGL